MKIQNFRALSEGGPMRKSALEIIEAGLEAVDTREVILRNVKVDGDNLVIGSTSIPFKDFDRIKVVAVGKCALGASMALEEILGEHLDSGHALDIVPGRLDKIIYHQGDHPFSTDRNIAASGEIINFLKSSTERDFIIFVVSGGGSALLCQPKGLSLEAETDLIKKLFKAGANIKELNTLRKHLSLARGGFFAEYAYPARSISLVFSDVPGDDMEFISSGATVKDVTTIDDAKAILAKYGLEVEENALIETPKDDAFFSKTSAFLAVSNSTALEAMSKKANEMGYMPFIKTKTFQGEARQIGLEMLQELRRTPMKTVLLAGGESTVNIKGSGKGGRNMEMSLSVLREIEKDELLISMASDGMDNTDAAGGICDIVSKEKANRFNLSIQEYLDNNDSYTFFTRLGESIVTGDTKSNVADLIIAIHE